MNDEPGPSIGKRIHVTGNVASGKSTLAHRLAEALDAPLVELDALNWLPGWVGLNQTDPDECEQRIREATRGERTQHARKRRDMLERLADPRWEHIRFVRLRSALEVEEAIHRSAQTGPPSDARGKEAHDGPLRRL